MFCPNCGNNCENANFCPKCGTKLPQQAQNESAAWQIGMPCPHCGGTKLDGDCCAFCGALLREETTPKYEFQIPYGVYMGASGSWIELRENHLVIKNAKQREYTIAYKRLRKVAYFPVKWYTFGRIIIRWDANENIPIPVELAKIIEDETSVPFLAEDQEKFLKVYREIQNLINGMQ